MVSATPVMPATWVLTKERYGAGPGATGGCPLLRQGRPGGVDVLPELDRHHVAHAPGVLPGRRQRAGDGRAALRIGGQPLGGLPQGLVLHVGQAHDGQEAAGGVAALGVALLEGLEHRDVEDARRPLGPLDIAADPEDGLGHPAEEGLGHCCCCCCWLRFSESPPGPASMGGPALTSGLLARRQRGQRGPPADHPGVLGAAPLAGVDHQPALLEGHPGQPAGQDPHVLAVVDREGPQVDVAAHHGLVHPGG